MNRIILILSVLFFFSCSGEVETLENREENVLEGEGTLWLSGGLMYCDAQVRMENGDTLIPNQFSVELMKLKTGNRIKLKYQKLSVRESGCTIGKDCKIIEVRVID